MIKKTFLLGCIICFFGCASKKNSVEKKPSIKYSSRIPFENTFTAKKDANGDLVGIAQKANFLEDAYKNWFDNRYKEYTPDKQVVSEISNHINQLTIKVFMGTWCGDSQREIPKLYKILDLTTFDVNYLQLIAVDRTKKHENLEKDLNISRVPTIIFYKNEKEIGRFVEYPRETIEKDILKIVSEQPYKHSYEKD